jgi:hypothetical protein
MAVRVQDRAAIVNILNDDDSVFTVTGCAAFAAHGNTYRFCGEYGQVQNVLDSEKRVLLRYNKWDLPEGEEETRRFYVPDIKDKDDALIEKAGHGGGDFFIVREFFNSIRENKKPLFDEYFATSMASVAILGHRSALEYGKPYDIPDFRKEEDRVKYENDFLTPCYDSKGNTPTIANTERAEYIPTEETMKAYDDAIAVYREAHPDED